MHGTNQATDRKAEIFATWQGAYLSIPDDWNIIPAPEASQLLFKKLVGMFLEGKGWAISADPTVRILTQRLYGDYRQVHKTAEFKRAERHIHHFKNTGLGKELF